MSSTEPSTGTSPATLTIAVSDSSDTYGDRLEQLLVGPAGLARLLVQVHRRVAALLEQRAQVAQQRRLARVGGVPVAGARRPRRCRRRPGAPCACGWRGRAGCGSARRRRARSARASAARGCRGAARRGSARSRAARRASRRGRRGSSGSCPPEAIAPLRTGSEPSGAVRSSWMWNRLICVFMARPLGLGRRGCALHFVSVGTDERRPARRADGRDGTRRSGSRGASAPRVRGSPRRRSRSRSGSAAGRARRPRPRSARARRRSTRRACAPGGGARRGTIGSGRGAPPGGR